MFYLDKNEVEEFFELYKGLFQEYKMMVDHLSSDGPCLVLEIR